MKMALIDPTGVVVGLLDGDTAKTFTPQPGYVLRVAEDAKVGDTWAGTTYIPRGLATDNRVALLAKITTALTANATDVTQDAAIITQATALAATTGTRTTAQLSGDVRALATACKILAGNDINAKRELNAIMRLIAGQLDDIAGT